MPAPGGKGHGGSIGGPAFGLGRAVVGVPDELGRDRYIAGR